ncbi:hypothetical protein RKD41_005126 [Streptomyces tendae]
MGADQPWWIRDGVREQALTCGRANDGPRQAFHLAQMVQLRQLRSCHTAQ